MSDPADERESLARSSLVEAIGIITLVRPTWRIFRYGMGFEDYLRHRGAAIHYVFVSSVVAATGLKFAKAFGTDIEAETPNTSVEERGTAAFDPDTWERWLVGVNEFLHKMTPGVDVRWELADVLPYFYFLFAILAGFLTHGVFRVGRRFIPARAARWLRLRSRLPIKDSCPNAITAICYGLGFFLILYSMQAMVLFVSHRWGQTQVLAANALMWVWVVFLFRGFWVLFVGIPKWLSTIYGVRLPIIYVTGSMTAALVYGFVNLIIAIL